MTSRRAFVIAFMMMIGCAAPLTVAEERDAGPGPPEAGEFAETGDLDSGFTGDGDFIGDLPSMDGGEDG